MDNIIWAHQYFAISLAIVVLNYVTGPRTIGKNLYQAIIISAACLFSLFISLRDINIGVDTSSYYDFFSGKDVEISEPIFNVLRQIDIGPRISLFFISIFHTICAYIFFNKFSNNPNIAFALYLSSFVFLNSQINIIRQGFAMGLFWMAIVIDNRKNKILLVLFACMTHYSAAIISMATFLGLVMRKRFPKIVYVVVLLCIFLYYIDLSSVVINFAGDIPFVERMTWYLTWNEGKTWEIKHLFFIFIPVYLLALNDFFKFKLTSMSHEAYIVLVIFCTAMMFKREEMFADRLIYYSAPFYIILILNYFDKISNKKIKFYLFAALIIVWLLKTSYLQLPGWFINYD